MQEVHFHTERKVIYPYLVNAGQFGILTKLKANIDRAPIGNNLFLGYCKIHRNYYIDYCHTNGEIRCPLCDKEWLINRHRLFKE